MQQYSHAYTWTKTYTYRNMDVKYADMGLTVKNVWALYTLNSVSPTAATSLLFRNYMKTSSQSPVVGSWERFGVL